MWRRHRRQSPPRLLGGDPLQLRLGLEQVQAALDEGEQRRHRALLLDLLLDEPLEELEGPVVVRLAGRGGEILELLGDATLAGLRDRDRLARGLVGGERAADCRQVELDLVVDEEVDDLPAMAGLLDRLRVEELGPPFRLSRVK